MKIISFLNKVNLAKAGFALVLIMSITVISGWLLNIPTLIQVSKTFVPMQFNTALCFAFISISTIAYFYKFTKTYVLFLLLPGSIALLTLIQYIFELNFGLDELFMNHYILTETSHPGRMAPNTALCFLLSAASLYFLKNKKEEISGIISSLIFGLALVAFIGYFIKTDYTYGWGSLTKMAIHTASGFLVFALSLSNIITHSLFKKGKDLIILGHCCALIFTFYLIDINTPLGMADGTLYVMVVLYAWNFKNNWYVIAATVVSSILIGLGYYNSPVLDMKFMALANRIVSLAVVWVTYSLIYRLKQQEFKLYKGNKLLLEQNSNLENFTYIASHDLQEPLRTIKSLSQFIAEDLIEPPEEVVKNLNRLNNSANRMSELVKGLLDLSKIGKDKVKEEVEVNLLVNAIQLDLMASIEEKKAQIIIEKPLPVVLGFKTELRLLFQNLISNSLKFQKPGAKPVITISSNEEDRFWSFSIQDNGIGMEQKHLNKIFDIFRRLHTNKSYSGTGIGLAHCKKIVQAHNGTIYARSVIGEGTNITFSIAKF